MYNFAIDQATLKPEHKALLKGLTLLIKGSKASNLELLIMGHTDSSGEADVNNPISKRRAQTVQKQLTTGASIPSRTLWFGEDRPLATNDTVDGRSRNRRVDIYLLPRARVAPKKVEKPGEPEIDIIIFLRTGRKVKKTEPKKKKDDKPEKKEEPKDEDDGGKDNGGGGGGGGGDGWSFPNPCDSILLAAVCAAGGGWAAKKIFCAAEPEIRAILEWLKDDDDDDKKPPEDKDEPEKDKQRKACPVSVNCLRDFM